MNFTLFFENFEKYFVFQKKDSYLNKNEILFFQKT